MKRLRVMGWLVVAGVAVGVAAQVKVAPGAVSADGAWPAYTPGTVVQLPMGPGRAFPEAAAGGTVTGHVYCSDTQRPARFAEVELMQEMEARSGRAGRGPSYSSVARARTALDGSFVVTRVPVGEYYVVATMTGYVSPVAVARMSGKAIAGVPMAHVDVNRSADVVVGMERGAVVAGRVTYDDGSPVAGVSVRLRSLQGASGGDGGGVAFLEMFGGAVSFGSVTGMAETDDRGAYRIVGVAPGKYVVTTTVQTETPGVGRSAAARMVFRGPSPSLTVYAPATMHKAEAQVVEVRGGEVVDGVDVRVALNGLHAVKGVVEAKADSHLLNAGMATLSDASDNSAVRTAVVDADGSFRMEYVPAGTYTLSVTGMDRVMDSEGRRPGSVSMKRYEPGTVSLTVGEHDVALDPVQLDEPKSSQAAGR